MTLDHTLVWLDIHVLGRLWIQEAESAPSGTEMQPKHFLFPDQPLSQVAFYENEWSLVLYSEKHYWEMLLL